MNVSRRKILHDFNSSVAMISLNLEMLGTDGISEHARRECADESRQELLRLSDNLTRMGALLEANT